MSACVGGLLEGGDTVAAHVAAAAAAERAGGGSGSGNRVSARRTTAAARTMTAHAWGPGRAPMAVGATGGTNPRLPSAAPEGPPDKMHGGIEAEAHLEGGKRRGRAHPS